jgi:Concanavalin A-like lectin/glucanases superfamily/Calcineurin-like phosphoesterase
MERDKRRCAVLCIAMSIWMSLAFLAMALALPAPAGAQTPTPTRTPTPTPTPVPDPVIGAAGDIACDPADPDFNNGEGTPGHCRQKATSDVLVAAKPAAVLALGDTQYERGILSTYAQSYDATWGRLKEITHPAVGNHEYSGGNGDGGGYYDYFNGIGADNGPAGPRGRDYYSYDIGGWHLIALDSVCSQVGGCGPGSPQEEWLRADLAAHPAACTLAYWHHPRFTSTGVGWTSMDTIWRDLYNAGADVTLAGHIHHYERFTPQDPEGRPDAAFGIREFIVGTGGKNLQGPAPAPLPTSEATGTSSFGVLFLTLHPGGYDWRFVPTDARGYRDSGTTACHGVPPGRPATGATGPAIVTGKTSVRLTGAVDPGGQATSFRFEWGTAAAYGRSTTETGVGGVADGARQVTARITGLRRGRTYHYRLVAANAAGVAVGSDRTFRAGTRSSYPGSVARTAGLLAYWRLDDAGLAFDEQGTNLAVGSGRIPLARGALVGGHSLAGVFDGGTASMEADGPVVATSATLEGWFRWTAGAILLKDDSSAGGWQIGQSGNSLGYRVTGRVYRTSRWIGRVRDGAWHHIALTKDGPRVAIYVDGRRVHSGNGASNTPPTMPWHIMRNGPFEQHTQGDADEVAIYGRALSAATIRSHYDEGVALRAPVTKIDGPDGPTNDADPVFRLSSSARRSTLRCWFKTPEHAGTVGPCGASTTFGHLADGRYALNAYAIDSTGHPDPTPHEVEFTVDTVPPALALTAPVSVPGSLRSRGLVLRAACSETCTVRARLSVAAGEASRLHLGKGQRALIGSVEQRISRAGARAMRIRLSQRVRKRLKGKRLPAVTLHVVATDRAGNRAAERRELPS